MGKDKKPGKREHPSKAENPTSEGAQLVPTPPRRPAPFRLLDDVRTAVEAILDIADAVAAALTKGLQRGA